MQVMSMIEIPRFGIGEFVAATNSLFEGCLNTVGMKDDKKDKYYLDNNRAFTDYVREYSKGGAPLFAYKKPSWYLNRCRYFIYQEKRTTTTEGNEITTISAEAFSQKTVRLFFELFGVNFIFLRLQPIDDKASPADADFRRMQELLLDDLFTVTVKYLCKHQSFDNNKESYGIPNCELERFFVLLYKKYRYLLCVKAPFPQKYLLNEELSHHVDIFKAAYQDILKLNILFDESTTDGILVTFDDIIDGRKKTIQRLEMGYQIEKECMNELVQTIQHILELDANDKNAIQAIYQKYVRQDGWDNYSKIVKKPSKLVHWKQWLINHAIKNFFQQRKYSVFASVLYLQNFEEAVQEYREICEMMWEMILSVSDNMEVVTHLINGNIHKLICELDDTLWFLYYCNENLYTDEAIQKLGR